MYYAQLAVSDKCALRPAAAKKHIGLAFAYERNAADLVADETIEPTRSVLHRSAATLALECGEIAEARRLVRQGQQNAPLDFAVELQELWDKIEKEHPSPEGAEGNE